MDEETDDMGRHVYPRTRPDDGVRVLDVLDENRRLLAIESAARDLDAALGETADDVPGRARPALLMLRCALAV